MATSITEAQLEAYVIGGLKHSGVICTPSESNQVLGVYRQALANGHYHLPYFLVLDLWFVLKKGFEVRFQSEKEIAGDDEGIDRKLRMRYEREFLGRLLQAPDVNTAMEIASTSPDQDAVTERLLLQILRSIAPHFPKNFIINPGLLRDFTIRNDFSTAEFDSFDFSPLIEPLLANLNANVRWGQLLHDEDLFELTHLEALSTDHLRIGCRQILEVSRLLRNAEPLHLDLTSHEDGADTAFLDETHYPTGGLAGLTNRGSFENLLTSELVYLNEGTKDVSLFELRYAEGELLFYLRDSGNLRRKRRSIHFVVDVGRAFQSKPRGYAWQYSVLLQGICLRLLHDLFEVFEMDALRFHFHYIRGTTSATGEDVDFFHGEISMMQTVLSDYVKHEWVTFEVAESMQDLESLIDPKRKSYAIIIAAPESISEWSERIDVIAKQELGIHTALIAVDQSEDPSMPLVAPTSVISFPRSGLSIDEMSRRKNAVLEQLVQ